VKLSELKVNSARAEQGAWVGDIPDLPGVRIKARGFGNKDDKKVQERELEKIPKRRRLRGNVTAEEQRIILNVRLKQALITDWDGIEGDNGGPWPFTPENMEIALSDPDYGKLRDAMTFACGIVAEDDAEGDEDDAKN
jgi:hypothetical protein